MKIKVTAKYLEGALLIVGIVLTIELSPLLPASVNSQNTGTLAALLAVMVSCMTLWLTFRERSASMRNALVTKRMEVYWETLSGMVNAGKAMNELGAAKQNGGSVEIDSLAAKLVEATNQAYSQIQRSTFLGSTEVAVEATRWLYHFATRSDIVYSRLYINRLSEEREADVEMGRAFSRIFVACRADLGIVGLGEQWSTILKQTITAKSDPLS